MVLKEGQAVAQRTVLQGVGFPVRLQAPGVCAGLRTVGGLEAPADKGAILTGSPRQGWLCQGVSVAPPPDLYITTQSVRNWVVTPERFTEVA